MPPGRSQRPLFDLISSKEGPADSARRPNAPTPAPSGAAPVSKPVVRVELKPRDTTREPLLPDAPEPATETTPRPQPRTRPPETLATGSTPSGALGAILGDQTVRLPRNVIFLSIAAVIVIIVAVWALASSRGEARAVKALEKQFGTDVTLPDSANPNIREPDAPLPRDPLAAEPRSPSSANPAPSARNTPAGTSTRPSQNPSAANQISPPAGAVITSRGFLTADPRERGLNYCVLAVLSGPDAKRAVDFLAENGVDAIGLPVDARGRSANNQGPQLAYQVIALPGITREEYAQKRTARTNLEANVTRLGQIWQREHRGSSNFARFSWTKFE